MTNLVEIAPPRFDVSLALAYATDDNVTGHPIYRRAACYLHCDAAALLDRAIGLAAAQGLNPSWHFFASHALYRVDVTR